MFKVRTHYSMADEVKNLFNEKDYPTEVKTTLQDKQ
mgnify:FL=1